MEDALDRIENRIAGLLARKGRVLVGIDGNCAAGKTTLAARLARNFDCGVFHMDDFFLRPVQRRPERYAQPGGNVDYERFAGEVLTPLLAGEPFSYRPFDCRVLELAPPVEAVPGALSIVEGSYSLHPYFGDPWDLKIFLTVSPERQRERILLRPEFLHRRFFEDWIPMEQRYFEAFGIRSRCDLTADTTENSLRIPE